MACVCVAAKYENQGIGLRLVSFVEERARELGVKALFCLSTQAVNYFVQKGGFRWAPPMICHRAARGATMRAVVVRRS